MCTLYLMEYRCLFKAAQEKVYTSNYYQKKKKKPCTKFSSLATLWVSLCFGSVLCHWYQVTHPNILPSFSKNGGESACSNWISRPGGGGWFRLCGLASVLGAGDSSWFSLHLTQTSFCSTSWLKSILTILKMKLIFLIFWKKNYWHSVE